MPRPALALCMALITAGLIAGCTNPATPPQQAALQAVEPVAAEPAPPYDVRAALAAADRSPADLARDVGRKPAEVLEFVGVGPGMTVLDLIAAGGWYTEVLAAAVGAEGRVYAQNPAVVLQFNDGANDKALTARLADDRLPNVTRLDVEINVLGLAPESVDVVLTALNFHDVYNRDPAQAAGVAQVVRAVLKPGGVFAVIDHDGNADADNTKLHRMPKADAVAVLEAAGFVVEASDVLANAEDDRSQFVFAEGLRGKTDRFLLKAVKPAG